MISYDMISYHTLYDIILYIYMRVIISYENTRNIIISFKITRRVHTHNTNV